MADEKNYHVRVVKELRTDKAELKKQLKEEGLSYISDVKNLDDDLERGLKELREQFHNQKEELIAKYEEKMVKLREDLELRLKVEIH